MADNRWGHCRKCRVIALFASLTSRHSIACVGHYIRLYSTASLLEELLMVKCLTVQCRQQFSKQTKELDQHNYQIREISIRNFRLKVEPSVESEMPEPWKWTLMKTALIDVLLCSIYKLNITLKDYKGAVKLSFNTFRFRNTCLFETQCWRWIYTWKSDTVLQTHDLFRVFFFCIILLVSLFLTGSILNTVYGDDTLSLPQS